MGHPGVFLPRGNAAHLPATSAQLAETEQRMEIGLQRGVLAEGRE